MAHFCWKNFFWYKQIKKYRDTADLELWGCTIFGPKMVHLTQTHFFFFWKIINITLIYLSILPLCPNFKKFFQQIWSYEDAQFLGPKWPIFPNETFFRKPVNEPCSCHSCLSTSQKSKSDINLLVKYWWLKNTETSLVDSFLAIIWEPNFSQAWSFCRMLMNHKNFHFTQIPDKTNDVIFLKSPKTMFLGHFWPFLVIFAGWGFFQKFWLSNTTI